MLARVAIKVRARRQGQYIITIFGYMHWILSWIWWQTLRLVKSSKRLKAMCWHPLIWSVRSRDDAIA